MAGTTNRPEDTVEHGVDDEYDDVPTRVCPHCATLSHSSGEFCPHCGKPFAKSRASRRVKVALIAGLVLLLLGGGGAAIAIKVHNDEHAEKQKKARIAAAAAATRAQQVAQEQAEAAEHEKAEKVQREEHERKTLERELEKAVEKDAKKLVGEGTLEEPIIGASCTPVSGGSAANLGSPTGTYNCIAITKREAGGETSGYRFSGNIDFAGGSYSYHLGG